MIDLTRLTFGQILFVMVGMHIIADFICQGWFMDGKQRAWWVKMSLQELKRPLGETKYRYDYLVGIVLHSLFWSMLVCLPFFAWTSLWKAVLLNTVFHAVIDDLKANRGILNTIQDQMLHGIQIVVTLYLMCGF